MNLRLLLVTVAFVAACSAKQSSERDTPQCLSLCGNQFAACTEEYPGDAAACMPARNDCERTCRGDKAVERMEEGTPEMLAPISRPDAGGTTPDGGPDGGN